MLLNYNYAHYIETIMQFLEYWARKLRFSIAVRINVIQTGNTSKCGCQRQVCALFSLGTNIQPVWKKVCGK